MTGDDLAGIMPDVARQLWGEPNRARSTRTELRWGSNGARSVDLTKGVWFDFEAKEGGGVLDLIKRERTADPWEWLREHGYDNDADRGSKRRKMVATYYDYTDESGALLFQVCRLDPKDFRQRRRPRPDDPPDKVKDGWVWSVKGVRQVPFVCRTARGRCARAPGICRRRREGLRHAGPPRHCRDHQCRRGRQVERGLCRSFP